MSAILVLVGLLVVLLLFYWSLQSIFGMLAGGGPVGDLLGFTGHGLVGLIATLVGFAIAGFAVYTAERVIDEDADVFHALGTAAIASVVIVLVGWVPMVGPLLALLGWLTVLYVRYEASWVNAAVVAGVSWLLAFVITGAFHLVGAGVRAVGIPAV